MIRNNDIIAVGSKWFCVWAILTWSGHTLGEFHFKALILDTTLCGCYQIMVVCSQFVSRVITTVASVMTG